MPIEIVNIIFSYISSPTSILIKHSIYYHEICSIRFLNYNEDDLSTNVRNDYLSFYNAYLQYEYILDDFYMYIEDQPPSKLDAESLYAYIYRYIFQRGSQQQLSTMWTQFISKYNKEKMDILQNYLKLYHVIK